MLILTAYRIAALCAPLTCDLLAIAKFLVEIQCRSVHSKRQQITVKTTERVSKHAERIRGTVDDEMYPPLLLSHCPRRSSINRADH